MWLDCGLLSCMQSQVIPADCKQLPLVLRQLLAQRCAARASLRLCLCSLRVRNLTSSAVPLRLWFMLCLSTLSLACCYCCY